MSATAYWHVDAFAGRPFSGNQAAVLLLEDWPADAVLQAIAAEIGFADTAFLCPWDGGSAEYSLRWFSPATEVRLCGHATLAAGYVLLARDPDLRAIRFATRHAGVLEVTGMGERCEVALPAIALDDTPPPAIARGLGAVPSDIRWNDQGYALCRFADETQLRALEPDMAQLAAHGPTMFICTTRGTRHDVVSRVFVPGAGVPEDSVTGSAHAALATYWPAFLGRNHFTASQASVRGGELTCRLDGARALIGGACVTIAEGRFYLPG